MKIVAEKTIYHRFALYYNYSQDRVDFCKDLKDGFGYRKFSFESQGQLKRWVFSDPIFVRLITEKFPEAFVEPAVVSLINEEVNWDKERKAAENKVDHIREKKDTEFSVKGLKMDMYAYQKVGTEFLVASGGRAIIADAPGLGKTIQALAYAKHMGFKRILVVCPASVKFAWESEVKKWTNMKSVVLTSKTNLAKIPSDVEVWIMNYDILRKHLEQLSKIRFDCLIGDECHLVKSPKALRTKAFKSLSRDIHSIVLLSGTPLLSRPSELYSLLNIIDMKNWDNWYDFVRRYCAMHRTPWGMDASGASNIEELHQRIKRYFIRRDKTEVLKELPPKTFISMPIELSGEHAEKYDSAARSLAEYLEKFEDKNDAEIASSLAAEKLTKLNVLRQINAMGKVSTATELIESILEAGEKVLVFCSFIEPLRRLKEHFGDQAVVLTGETPIEDRKGIVETFQNDPKVSVFLGGIKSAGVGITLTAASNVLFLDYSWNPADHQQAQDRVHRPGQVAKSVNIYQLSAIETIDEDLKDMLDHKQDIFEKVIEGKVETKRSEAAMKAAIDRVLKNYPKKS